MRDGHLGQVDIEKSCIELKTGDTHRSQFSPYKAGPRLQKFKGAIIEMLLLQKVVEPSKQNAPQKWYLFESKTNSYSFAQTTENGTPLSSATHTGYFE